MNLKANNGQTNGGVAVAMMTKVGVDARVNGFTVINLDTEDALVVVRVRSPFNGSVYCSIKQATLTKGVLATQLLTITGQPATTGTVTIDGKVYTFLTTLTGPPSADGEIFIAATAALTRDNLMNALDLAGVAGTDYGTAMTLHPSVVGVANAGNLDVNAKFMGAGANKITTTEAATNMTMGGATLAGGVDPGVLEYGTPIGLKDDDSLEIVLGRDVLTTECDWTISYDE